MTCWALAGFGQNTRDLEQLRLYLDSTTSAAAHGRLHVALHIGVVVAGHIDRILGGCLRRLQRALEGCSNDQRGEGDTQEHVGLAHHDAGGAIGAAREQWAAGIVRHSENRQQLQQPILQRVVCGAPAHQVQHIVLLSREIVTASSRMEVEHSARPGISELPWTTMPILNLRAESGPDVGHTRTHADAGQAPEGRAYRERADAPIRGDDATGGEDRVVRDRTTTTAYRF